MNTLKSRIRSDCCSVAGALLMLAWLAGTVQAQTQAQTQVQGNAIEAVTARQQGSSVIVKITLQRPLAAVPASFAIVSPARIALDFGATANGTGKNLFDINLGDLRSINLVQAGERSRLVLNLKRPLGYVAAIDGNAVIVSIDGSPAVAPEPMLGPVGAAGVPARPRASDRAQLRDIDFRRGPNGEGRIVVGLPHNQVAIDVRQQGANVVIDFIKVGLPETLRKRLDVTDFGTPVSTIGSVQQGDNVRMTVEAKGLWEQSVYQGETQLVLEVKPIKEEANKLTQGSQGYRGEKLTFNFQSVEVRAALQAIADISGLNIITSDSVSGNLTLRLKEVPWDQALDVILQAKGLDMRKNGTVLWIAPREELLIKEKLELEQRAQIAELEPLRSEIFQLNYQKAEAFRTVFGLDLAGEGKNRVLSKRGSAIIEPRTNQLFVTDIAAKLDDVRKLIQKTDIASRQVLIEARIVEASDTFGRALGAKLGFADLRTARGGDSGYQIGGGNSRIALGGNLAGVGQVTGQMPGDASSIYSNSQLVNLPAASIGGAAPANLAISLFSAAANRFLNLELSALESDGKGKIVASPRVVTADNGQALIEQGIELPYTTPATASNPATISFRKASLRLEVTPQITPDGNVVLVVDVNKDSRGDLTSSGFAINTKRVKTQVMVENGGTVVLGGIYEQSENTSEFKVPLLGDIPYLGYLFKSTQRTREKTELLVFITPKIVAERLSTR